VRNSLADAFASTSVTTTLWKNSGWEFSAASGVDPQHLRNRHTEILKNPGLNWAGRVPRGKERPLSRSDCPVANG
jgi:hypothetical protein